MEDHRRSDIVAQSPETCTHDATVRDYYADCVQLRAQYGGAIVRHSLKDPDVRGSEDDGVEGVGEEMGDHRRSGIVAQA